MIRTLAIIAVVSFVLCMGSLAAAFAIAGGPFFIDDHFRFHHTTWSDDDGDSVDLQVGPPSTTAPAPVAPVPTAPAKHGHHHIGAPV